MRPGRAVCPRPRPGLDRRDPIAGSPYYSASNEGKGRKRLQRPLSFCVLGWAAGARAPAGPTGVAKSRAFRSRRVVHLELDRVRGVLEGEDLLPLELQVGVDLILGEDVAGEQEVVVRR